MPIFLFALSFIVFGVLSQPPPPDFCIKHSLDRYPKLKIEHVYGKRIYTCCTNNDECYRHWIESGTKWIYRKDFGSILETTAIYHGCPNDYLFYQTTLEKIAFQDKNEQLTSCCKLQRGPPDNECLYSIDRHDESGIHPEWKAFKDFVCPHGYKYGRVYYHPSGNRIPVCCKDVQMPGVAGTCQECLYHVLKGNSRVWVAEKEKDLSSPEMQEAVELIQQLNGCPINYSYYTTTRMDTSDETKNIITCCSLQSGAKYDDCRYHVQIGDQLEWTNASFAVIHEMYETCPYAHNISVGIDNTYNACCESPQLDDSCLYRVTVDGAGEWVTFNFSSPNKFTDGVRCSSNRTEKPDTTSTSSSGKALVPNSNWSSNCDCSGRRFGMPALTSTPDRKRLKYFKIVATIPQIINKRNNGPRRKFPQGRNGPNGPGGINYCPCP